MHFLKRPHFQVMITRSGSNTITLVIELDYGFDDNARFTKAHDPDGGVS